MPIIETMNHALSRPGIQRVFSTPGWAIIAAFGTYFCMYGFRKPYTAATYAPAVFWGIDYKFLLVISQTAGYVLAKWVGIKVVSEVKSNQRIKMLLYLIFFSEFTLFLFASLPRPWNIACMFLNGMSLGVVFGLILRFLEGRRHTELLIAGLCSSFIVSDGFSKSVGKLLLDQGASESWMPFNAGILFLIPILVFIGMLNLIPPPSTSDVEQRSERFPMPGKARRDFFFQYGPGLIGIIFVYLMVTLMRSIRGDFATELWAGLGYHQYPALFTQSELIVSFAVAIINGLAIFILNHRKAMRFSLFISLGGFLILLVALWGYTIGLNGFIFMVLVGFGVYIPYVAVHTTIFERLIAITREKANIGFLMYVADSVGYTGYILLMLSKYAFPSIDSILVLFLKLCFFSGLAGGLITLYCHLYFKRKFQTA
jgi:hypothetical protein